MRRQWHLRPRIIPHFHLPELDNRRDLRVRPWCSCSAQKQSEPGFNFCLRFMYKKSTRALIFSHDRAHVCSSTHLTREHHACTGTTRFLMARIHCGVEVTELSTNKQHTSSAPLLRTTKDGKQSEPGFNFYLRFMYKKSTRALYCSHDRAHVCNSTHVTRAHHACTGTTRRMIRSFNESIRATSFG
jgi:hypothetical protein